MRNVRKLRKKKSEFGEKSHHLTGNGLDIVLSANDDESSDFVLDQNTIGDCKLILNAIETLGHFEMERRRRAPSNRRRNQNDIRPVNQRVIDWRHTVVFIHLRDRTRPGARPSRFRIITLARPEIELAQFDKLGFRSMFARRDQ